jgi:hypothetical protein
MERGFYVVRIGDRRFEVCIHAIDVKDGENGLGYVRANDSGPIPWEALEKGEGEWTPGRVMTEDYDTILRDRIISEYRQREHDRLSAEQAAKTSREIAKLESYRKAYEALEYRDSDEMDIDVVVYEGWWPFGRRVGVTFRGSGTVWNRLDTGERASTSQEAQLADIWTKRQWELREKEEENDKARL